MEKIFKNSAEINISKIDNKTFWKFVLHGTIYILEILVILGFSAFWAYRFNVVIKIGDFPLENSLIIEILPLIIPLIALIYFYFRIAYFHFISAKENKKVYITFKDFSGKDVLCKDNAVHEFVIKVEVISDEGYNEKRD